MGGKPPYGFHSEPVKMDGINTKKLVMNPDEAEHIRLIFEMYADPKTSYGHMARLPQEADEQYENPVCKKGHPYMAGGENQVRQLWLCPYEYH